MKTVSYPGVRIDFDSSNHSYTIVPDGEAPIDLPSVTNILRVIDKGDVLANWQFKRTVEGMVELWRRGIQPVNADHAMVLLAEHGLRPDDHRDRKGKIGHNIHTALGGYAEDRPPSREEVAEHERIYLLGLTEWILRTRPVFHASEVPVCSLLHGFAGMFDYLRRCELGCPNCEGRALVLGDAKTTKEIWDEAHLQVAAYIGAHQELLPETPICHGELLLLQPDGKHKVEICVATFEDFLAVRDVRRRLDEVKIRRRQQKRSFKGHETSI